MGASALLGSAFSGDTIFDDFVSIIRIQIIQFRP